MRSRTVFYRYMVISVMMLALIGVLFYVSFDRWSPSKIVRSGVDQHKGSPVSEVTRQTAPTVEGVSPSVGFKGSEHEIMGGFFNDTKGRVGLEPLAGGGVIWLDAGEILGWSNSSINFTIPSNITEGDFRLVVGRSDGVTVGWGGLFRIVTRPVVGSVSPKDNIYRGTEINITGEGFGDVRGWVNFLITEDGKEKELRATIFEWNGSYILAEVPAYFKLKGTVSFVVVANGAASEPFKITIKEIVTIVDPRNEDEVSGVVTIEVRYRKGTEKLSVAVYPQSSGSSTGSSKPVFDKEYNVSEDSTSKKIVWDTTEVENEKHYHISVYTQGTYKVSGSDDVKVFVDQKVANIAAVIGVTLASAGAVGGAAAVAGGGVGAAGTAGAGVGTGAAGGGAGGGNWFLKLLSKLRKLFGDVVEEKGEDLVETGAGKVDDRLLAAGNLRDEMMEGIPWRAFLISLGIAAFAFSFFINGGIFGWKGWWPAFPISIGAALVIVAALMAVKNIFGFWLALRINLRRRWRMGIIGLFLLILSGLLGSPMGDIGELEDGGMKYSKRARKHLKAFGAMSTALVVLSMLIIFGALSLFKSDFVRFTVAYPGGFACLVLAFFPIIPFKSSPGYNVWKWNRAVSVGAVVVLFAIIILFSQLWIPGWSLLFVGGYSAVMLLILLFAFGAFGEFSTKGEIKARKYVNRAFSDDPAVRAKARKKIIKIMVKRPATLRECIPDIMAADSGSEEVRGEMLDLVTDGVEIAPWLFIPYRESLLTAKADAPGQEKVGSEKIADTLAEREENYRDLPDDSMRRSIMKLIQPRGLEREREETDMGKVDETKGVMEGEDGEERKEDGEERMGDEEERREAGEEGKEDGEERMGDEEEKEDGEERKENGEERREDEEEGKEDGEEGKEAGDKTEEVGEMEERMGDVDSWDEEGIEDVKALPPPAEPPERIPRDMEKRQEIAEKEQGETVDEGEKRAIGGAEGEVFELDLDMGKTIFEKEVDDAFPPPEELPEKEPKDRSETQEIAVGEERKTGRELFGSVSDGADTTIEKKEVRALPPPTEPPKKVPEGKRGAEEGPGRETGEAEAEGGMEDEIFELDLDEGDTLVEKEEVQPLPPPPGPPKDGNGS